MVEKVSGVNTVWCKKFLARSVSGVNCMVSKVSAQTVLGAESIWCRNHLVQQSIWCNFVGVKAVW